MGCAIFSPLFFFLPLNTGQYGSDIVCRTPPILQYIQAQFPRVVYVWMKHLTDELDPWRLIRVLLLKVHHQPKSAIFKWRVRRPDDDGVPISYSTKQTYQENRFLFAWSEVEWGERFHCQLVPQGRHGGRCFRGRRGGKRVIYHVITLSAIGEADTPAGGSVCIRCLYQYDKSALTFHKESTTRHGKLDLCLCYIRCKKNGSQTLKSRIRRRRAEVDMVFIFIFLFLLYMYFPPQPKGYVVLTRGLKYQEGKTEYRSLRGLRME